MVAYSPATSVLATQHETGPLIGELARMNKTLLRECRHMGLLRVGQRTLITRS